SGFRSMSPRSRLSPRAPKKPLSMRVERISSSPRSPTTDIAGRRSIPPVTRTVMPGESASAAAIRRPFVTTTSSRRPRSSRARKYAVVRDRLAVVDHRRGGAGDRPLLVRLEPEPDVERELGVAALERSDAAAHARDEALAGELGEVVADSDLRDRERLRKLGDAHAVA